MAEARLSSRSAAAAASLLLLLSAISASFLGTSAVGAAAQQKSQAGCACLDMWFDAQGGQHSGCANPGNDPQGPWCQVNPSVCQGYYSSHVDDKGNSVFFDYCGDVRETTVNGCLCAPDWSLSTPGVGKPHYRDRCASPHKQGERICKVDYATCPPGSSAGEYDTCSNTTETLTTQLQQQQPAKATTYHKCKCHDTWWYAYADGTVEEFTGCANPDGDALGAWCAVDPELCDNYAGQIKQTVNETLHYDYCDVQYKPHFAGACALSLKEFEQCGGKALCSDTGCMDAPWPGACCSEGTTCHRQNAFYHQCLSADNIGLLEQGKLESGSYPDSSSFFAPSGAPTLPGAQQTQPLINPVTNFPASSSSAGATPGFAAPYGASVTEDVVRVYIKMKIDTNYTDLDASPEKMAWFKNDITGWMKGIATDQSYVQGAGVEELSPGLIVVAFLQFAPGTPLSVIQATMARLTANTASLYASTNLPTSWGKLLGSTVAQNAADLMDINNSPLTGGFLADPAAALGSTARPGALTPPDTAYGRGVKNTQKASNGRLGGGAIAGIIVGVIAIIAVSGFVISRTLADKARKKHDEDISKKLDYTTELKEVDLEETEGQLASVCVSDATRGMWSWLRKAETVKPVEVPDNKVVISTAVSTVSSLTAHGSDNCIAANTPPTNTKCAPFPEDAILRGASDGGAPDVHQTATQAAQHAAAAASAPQTGKAPVDAASNHSEARKPSDHSDSEVPATLPYNYMLDSAYDTPAVPTTSHYYLQAVVGTFAVQQTPFLVGT